MAVLAKHRTYNNSLYNNLEEKVQGLNETPKRKETKFLKISRLQDVKTCRPLCNHP